MVVATEETTRICRACSIEKPIDAFVQKQRWRLRTCRQCRYNQEKDAISERRRKHYHEHPEQYAARAREFHLKHWPEYYQKHKEVRKQRSRDYYAEQRPKNLELYGTVCSPERLKQVKEYNEVIRADNVVRHGTRKSPDELENQCLHYREMRVKALNYYGGKCECCGEFRYDMLTFDHKIKTYYKNKVRGVGLVYEVVKEYKASGFPNDKYRVLCWNCNTSRGFYGYCPHKQQGDWDVNKGRRKKLEVIVAYGGQCQLCGESHPEFLTIDHINGGGTQHRLKVGSIYKFLKKSDFPQKEYRLLCANCNCSDKKNGWSKKEVLS